MKPKERSEKKVTFKKNKKKFGEFMKIVEGK